jgi:hypothetical protein
LPISLSFSIVSALQHVSRHAPRPALRLGPKQQKIVGGQTSGRDRQDKRGAADPESGNARLIEVPMVNAWSRIAMLVRDRGELPNDQPGLLPKLIRAR